MMHVRIIQKLLKKLVQVRQKIDIPQLETNWLLTKAKFIRRILHKPQLESFGGMINN